MDAVRTTITDELIDFIVSSPTLTQMAEFRFSDDFRERYRYLLDANRNGTLTSEEHAELNRFEWLDNLVIDLKLRARQQLAKQAQA